MKRRRGNCCGTLVSKGPGKPFLVRWTWRGKSYSKSTGEVERSKALKAAEAITFPFRAKSESETLRLLAERAKEAERVEYSVTHGLGVAALEKAMLRSPAFVDLAPRSLGAYSSYVGQFVSWIKKNTNVVDVSHVDGEIAGKYAEWLMGHTCATTYNIRIAFLRKLWKAVWDEAGMRGRENPWDRVQRRVVSSGTGRRAYSPAEVLRLMEAANGDMDTIVLFHLGLFVGGRLGDMACMKWSSVDFGRNEIRYTPEKTKRWGTVVVIPIHPELRAVLEKVRVMGVEGEYVSERNARMYTRDTIERRLRGVFERAGLPVTEVDGRGRRRFVGGFHGLRHTFVSRAIASGMSPFVLHKVVGHTGMDMTELYYHSSEAEIRRGIAALPGYAPQEKESDEVRYPGNHDAFLKT